jgi:hypothetical protein
MNRLPASTGWLWLKQGFALFRKQPGLLTVLLFFNLTLTMLLAVIPLLGAVLSMVLTPALSVVIFQACRQLDVGEPVTYGVMLTGFSKGKAGPLAKLGLVYLAIVVVLAIVVIVPWVDMETLQTAVKAAQAKQEPVIPAATIYAVYTFFGLGALMYMLLSFAPALTHWKNMPTFKAIFYSVFAIFHSLVPMLVMLGAWFGIYFVALNTLMLLVGRTQFGIVLLMWLAMIFAVVLQCALYSAYRHLLPDTAPSAD